MYNWYPSSHYVHYTEIGKSFINVSFNELLIGSILNKNSVKLYVYEYYQHYLQFLGHESQNPVNIFG